MAYQYGLIKGAGMEGADYVAKIVESLHQDGWRAVGGISIAVHTDTKGQFHEIFCQAVERNIDA